MVGGAGRGGREESPGEQHPAGLPGEARCAPGGSLWIPQPSELLDALSGRPENRGCQEPFVHLGSGVEQEMCKDGNGLHR